MSKKSLKISQKLTVTPKKRIEKSAAIFFQFQFLYGTIKSRYFRKNKDLIMSFLNTVKIVQNY